MKKILIAFCFLLFTASSFSQQYNEGYKCYPKHWWKGMKTNNIQLMIYGDAIANADGFTINHPGITLKKATKLESNNYYFLDITIAPNVKPGIVKLVPKNFRATPYVQFEIKEREKGNGVTRIKGVSSEDFIYLIMPDRFCNGDMSNDYFSDMRDVEHDRNNPFDRHGGDLQGVESKLDYLKDLGVTAIWMTPVSENDMTRTQEAGTTRSTYHGYAITNHYEVDKRFGGNAAYKKLADEAHKKGLKIIQDAVYNHAGNDHFLVKDLPAKDWLNQWPAYQNTTYRDLPILDPYASIIDRKIALDGWFTPFMVDWNQRNPFVEKYLTQYMIWNTEEFGVDGWRVDTYFYSEPSFLNKLNDALFKEYPHLGYFGETLVGQTTVASYFAKNNYNNVPFKSNCPGITDFPLTLAMLDAFRQPQGWSDGIYKVYQTLAQDFLYQNPMGNCIFLGNHDMDRVYANMGEDMNKMKSIHTLLLTMRGIPQMYYGDEILMNKFKDPTDAEVRKDFPGGWPADGIDKFAATGRTKQENEFFDFLKKFANYRKSSTALKTGKLMQYLPQDGLYVYFRFDAAQTVMVVINSNKDEKNVEVKRFAERIAGFKKWKDVMLNSTGVVEDFKIGGMQSKVLELQK